MVNVIDLSKHISKLSIFLFIIAGNYVGDIYSCSLRHLFNKYMFLKHIIGILIMIFFVGLTDVNLSVYEKIYQSVLLYLLFILIMRTPMIITMVIILIIAIIYLLHLYLDDLNKENENGLDNNGLDNNGLDNNGLDNSDEQNKNPTKLQQDIQFYTNLIQYLVYLIIFLSVGGTFFYITHLKYKLKNNFNILNFILGSRDQECFDKLPIQNFNEHGIFSDIRSVLVVNKKRVKDGVPFKLKKKLQ